MCLRAVLGIAVNESPFINILRLMILVLNFYSEDIKTKK